MLKANEAKINWLLHESKITRYQIAKATDISQAVLSNIYNGKSDLANITFGVASALTAYAKKMKDIQRGLVTLYYNDFEIYYKIYEVVTDRPMGVDDILTFSGLTCEDIATMLGFEAIDYENLTTEKDDKQSYNNAVADLAKAVKAETTTIGKKYLVETIEYEIDNDTIRNSWNYLETDNFIIAEEAARRIPEPSKRIGAIVSELVNGSYELVKEYK